MKIVPLLDMVDAVLSEQREREAQMTGCFAFPPYTCRKVKQKDEPVASNGFSRFIGHDGWGEDLKHPEPLPRHVIDAYWDNYRERAAIIQFEAGIDRDEAERKAFSEALVTIWAERSSNGW